jgi:Trypsin-like peptidase domain
MTADFERIKRAIPRIVARSNDTEKTGTGFFIGERFVLTALHVVADTRARPQTLLPSIKLYFPGTPTPVDAEVSPSFWDIDGDWAVLECKISPDAAPIERGSAPKLNDSWQTFGYPEIRPSGMAMAGNVRDPSVRPLVSTKELPGQPVLQLFGAEAAAGMGARLHGFSGAPCLVDGKAVGILRSTLIEEIYDGQLQRLLFTQAGTVYATPAANILEWLANQGQLRLPGSWAPPQIVAKDFVVLLSQIEAAVELDAEAERSAEKPQFLALRDVARQAYRRLKGSNLSEPFFSFAADVVASETKLEDCVRALCRAKVVIFDATGFEPAIMFLAGIRAVVRRGVTLLSVGGEYALGKELDLPFSIKDANIVAHSRDQNKSRASDSVTLLRDRIRRGLTEMGSPQYLDLPVYDSIRQLPADRRGIIPSEEGVLVLCPFDKDYETFWNNELYKALQNEMNALRDAKNIQVAPVVGVSRSYELNSPRLITQAVYEAIRRMQSCVIDLTRWSPNVLFELGVRLAASGNRTVCIADRKWEETVPAAWKMQCRNLASIFVTNDFLYNSVQPWEKQKVYSNAYGLEALPPPSGLLDGKLHTLIERALDLDCEPASRPVFVELQDHAALFSRDPGVSGRSKPVGLFPGNAELVRREEAAEYERLLAAWLYVSHRYAPNEILENRSIRDPVYTIIQTLFARHADRLDANTKDALSEMWDKIEALGGPNG